MAAICIRRTAQMPPQHLLMRQDPDALAVRHINQAACIVRQNTRDSAEGLNRPRMRRIAYVEHAEPTPRHYRRRECLLRLERRESPMAELLGFSAIASPELTRVNFCPQHVTDYFRFCRLAYIDNRENLPGQAAANTNTASCQLAAGTFVAAMRRTGTYGRSLSRLCKTDRNHQGMRKRESPEIARSAPEIAPATLVVRLAVRLILVIVILLFVIIF